MIARVAVLPQPPLLVPELVGGPDPDAQAVRDACLAVAGELATAAPVWFAVGADDSVTGEHPVPVEVGAAGTFSGYGVPVPVTLSAGSAAEPDPAMALPALIAGWLRGRVDAQRVGGWLLAPDLPVPTCRELGERLLADTGPEPVGLLVLGDGSHRHGARSVGRPDDRAGEFDRRVAAALAEADPDALLDVDPGLAAELGAVGRAPWQVLAGLAAADPRGWRCAHSALLLPFGVAYHLAVWEPRR